MSYAKSAKSRTSAFKKFMDNHGYELMPDVELWFEDAMKESFNAGVRYGKKRPHVPRKKP